MLYTAFMRHLILAAALAASMLTGCNQAPQSGQTDGAPGATASLSPEMRAQMQHLRLDAKTASMNALSAQHRTIVVTTAKQFDDGALSIPEAANKIDAVLTPQEASAVLAEQRKMRAAMRQAFSQAGGSSFGGRRGGGQGAGRTPDAGRFLVQLNASPDKWRAATTQSLPPTASP
jgi:hypothetical protein